MTEPDSAAAAMGLSRHVWVPNAREVWRLATVVSQTDELVTVIDEHDGDEPPPAAVTEGEGAGASGDAGEGAGGVGAAGRPPRTSDVARDATHPHDASHDLALDDLAQARRERERERERSSDDAPRRHLPPSRESDCPRPPSRTATSRVVDRALTRREVAISLPVPPGEVLTTAPSLRGARARGKQITAAARAAAGRPRLSADR